MKIVIVNQYAQPPDGPGNTRTHAFARELVARGHAVTVVAAPLGYMSRAPRGGRCKRHLIDGVRYRWLRVPTASGNNVGRIMGMLLFGCRVCLLRRTKGMDVVMGSSPSPFAAAGAAVLAFRARVPFVMEVRDLWPDSLVALGRIRASHLLVRLLRALERWLYRHAAAAISVLPDAVGVIEERGGPKGKVAWIPNGIDRAMVGSIDQSSGGSTGLTAIYAGAHGEPNGLDVVLDAAALLVDENRWTFRLIGDGVEKSRLIKRALDEQISNVRFEDPVPKSEIYDVLRQADVFVLPLRRADVFRYGVSPNKLFDYMALARPIVYAIAASNDPVGEARAGLSVPPESPVEMAAALRALDEMGAPGRAEMGRRGRDYSFEHHDLCRLAEKLESVLEGSIESTGSR